METARLYGNLNKYAYYFTDLLIGSPNPQRASVIVDTGSRLVGFPCSGCAHCGDHLDPAFDVSASRSARWLGCGDGCVRGCVDGQCTYSETYSEGSTISGQWFDDLVELGDSFSKNPPVHAKLGCHMRENKLFYTQRANGIMGLAPSSDSALGTGGNNTSRPTVLQDLFRDKRHVKTEIFAICLATWGGRLTVGGFDESYNVQDEMVHWTPMRASHYYFVFPDGLSLADPDGVTPATVASGNSEFGVTIIDSGTTYTYFPSPVYSALLRHIDAYCTAHNGCGATPFGHGCYRLKDVVAGPVGFPPLTLHFKGGARVDWSTRDYLHERGEQGVWCQTFMENHLYQTVLGISWMLHKNIIFDLEHNRLGVAKADCPEHHKESDYLQKNAIVPGPVMGGLGQSSRHIFVAAGLTLASVSLVVWVASLFRQRRPLAPGGQRLAAEAARASGAAVADAALLPLDDGAETEPEHRG